ncbi:MAG TPA: DUF1345 domain-containing protein [Myxococcales bacterium]|nr:DUF1345 domain-containing protein [Myxococcales bacterium]
MIDVRRAIPRTVISAGGGVAVWLLLSARLPPLLAALGGWNTGCLSLIAFAWHIIFTADAKVTARRAAAEDFGRTAISLLVVLASAASLVSVTILVRGAKGSVPEGRALAALCLTTVALAWTLTHTAFALRYAHLYYRDDHEGVGGVDFPGGARPRYADFAYLAFTIGMTFQVSDTGVSSPQIRRTVLLQAVLSFVYNTVILAFVLNLLFGMAA